MKKSVCVLVVALLASGMLPQRELYAQGMVAAERTTARSVDKETQSILARPVTVSLGPVSLRQAIEAVAASGDVRVSYTRSMVEAFTKPVTLRVVNLPLGVAFDQLLAGKGLKVDGMPGGQLVIVRRETGVSSTAQGILAGKVINGKTKQPAAGVQVLVGDARTGIMTGEDGTFRLSLEAGEHTIRFRGLGFGQETRRVTIRDGKTVMLEVVLESSASVLDEVIVTGTVVATQRREIATPITVITAEDIEKRGITRIEELFKGEVPGVYAADLGVAAYNSGLGAMVRSNVYVRGTADLGGGTNPFKTYIDGVEIVDKNALGTIDPRTIERIEIVTGPQAASIYGSGAMGGVMQIFTKRGRGRSSPEVALDVRYGMLESNISRGRTPTHNDALSLTGGMETALTYSGVLSYNYSGQWQPDLYQRTIGASLGISVSQQAFTLTGSANANTGGSGTPYNTANLLGQKKMWEGDWNTIPFVKALSGWKANFSSQTFALSADHIIRPPLRQSATVGISFTNYGLIPQEPNLQDFSDTLYYLEDQRGARLTVSYNMVFQPRPGRYVSSVLTWGANYSNGNQLKVTARLASENSTFNLSNPTINRPPDQTSWGYFGQWRIGLWNAMYWTLGIRAELSPTYGRNHKVDWVPANGLSYNIDLGDLSMKLLASYGSATRLPSPDMADEVVFDWCAPFWVCEPSYVFAQHGNPLLTPEYSRGPQGGVELYYGNVGSLSLNYYRQYVDDLIQQVIKDTAEIVNYTLNTTHMYLQRQYQNTASIRQVGWEGTGTFRVGSFSFQGTYSWTDSRVRSVNPTSDVGRWLRPGDVFGNLVSHTAYFGGSYAWGQTSISFTSNWTGKVSSSWNYGRTEVSETLYDIQNGRLKMYQYAASIPLKHQTLPSFWRSNVHISQRISSSLSFTANIKNIANSYMAHTAYENPILGRTSTFGVTYRWK